MDKKETKKTGVDVKIFLGFLQKSEIKMHLDHSDLWQRSKSLNENMLFQVDKNNQVYIGQWIIPPISYENLKKNESEIRSQLQLYCPKLKLDAHQLYLFTQIFVN